jgi:hypothetical protein
MSLLATGRRIFRAKRLANGSLSAWTSSRCRHEIGNRQHHGSDRNAGADYTCGRYTGAGLQNNVLSDAQVESRLDFLGMGRDCG